MTWLHAADGVDVDIDTDADVDGDILLIRER